MSQETKKYCEFPMCDRIEDRGGFCFLHAKHFAGPKPQAKMTAIPKQSEKRKVEQKEYVAIVKEMLATNPNCEIKSPVCIGVADGLDHVQKRSPNNFLDRKNLKRSCSPCNLYKELNPTWAEKNNHSKSRFKK